MEKLDFFALLSYGSIGLGCILAVLTYFLLRKEQGNLKPKKAILNSIYGFMVFSLLLCGMGIVAESVKKQSKGNGQTEPRPFPVGHPGNVIIPEVEAIAKEAIYRRNLKWEFAFSDMVPGTNRAKFKLSAEFEILNASDSTLDYLLQCDFEVPATFSAQKLQGEMAVKSAQGVVESQHSFTFKREKNIFSYHEAVRIPSGQTKILRWQTVDEIEHDIPYSDYLFSINPTETMEIRMRSGNTKLKPDIELQRANKTGTLEEISPGMFVFTAPGPFLPFQGVSFNFSISSP